MTFGEPVKPCLDCVDGRCTMNCSTPMKSKVESLTLEYRRIAMQLGALGAADALFDANRLRLEAREVEIVDALRDLGVSPDVLVAA